MDKPFVCDANRTPTIAWGYGKVPAFKLDALQSIEEAKKSDKDSNDTIKNNPDQAGSQQAQTQENQEP
jgi:hypothetical protein